MLQKVCFAFEHMREHSPQLADEKPLQDKAEYPIGGSGLSSLFCSGHISNTF